MTPTAMKTRFLICIWTLLLSFSLAAQNQPTAIPARVTFKTQQGKTFNGKVETLRGDTLSVRDKDNNLLLVSLSRLTSYQFFDAEGLPILNGNGQKLTVEPALASSNPTDSTNIPANRTTKVLVKTKKGQNLTGLLLWRRNDSIAIDAGIGEPIFLSINDLQTIEPLNENNRLASKQKSKVIVTTKTGEVLRGTLLWKNADSLALNVGIGAPVVVGTKQIESISNAEITENRTFRLADKGEKFDNYLAFRHLYTRTGLPMRRGENYFRVRIGLVGKSFEYEAGFRVTDYFRVYISSPSPLPIILVATPSVVLPLSSSMYFNLGVSGIFNPVGDGKIFQTYGMTGGFTFMRPNFNMALQVGTQRNFGFFTLPFSRANAFRPQIAVPIQYRFNQHWLFLGEYIVSPKFENIIFNQEAFGVRYMEPRFAVDLGFSFSQVKIERSNFDNTSNSVALVLGGTILIGKTAKKK